MSSPSVPDTTDSLSPLRKRYEQLRDEELQKIGSRPHLDAAVRIFDELILSDELADFLTIPAYEELLKEEGL